MLEQLLRQYGLGGFRYEGPNDKGGGSGRMTGAQATVSEETGDSVSLEEFTEQRLADAEEGADDEPSDEPTPKDEPTDEDEPTDQPEEDEDQLEPDYEEDDQPEEDDEPSDEDEPEEDGEPSDEDEPSDESEEEGDFYDPETFKEENEIDRDVPHTNKFPDRESAEYAAINKASMIRDALDELQELDADRGAVPLPDALQGSLDNLDELENMEFVANMDDSELNKFLWESDEFRHRIQDKGDRIKQKRESQQVTQEFEQLQEDLFNGVAEVLGGEDQITQDVIDTLDAGPSQGKEFLQEKIDAKIESELEADVQEIEDFIDSDEAADMSRKKFANKLEGMKSDLADRRDELREKYNGVVETYEEAFELAPKVQESKPKTEAEKVSQAYNSLEVWQEDAAEFSNLLIDDPGAKRELEAFVKNAMRNKEKFNDLQHPSDWNEAEDWWHNEFKPSIRGKRQKEKLNGDKDKKKSSSKSKSKKSDDDIDEPDPNAQDDMRNNKGDDVHSMNQSNLDSLVQETDAA
jgi:hypothetical protein